MPSFLLKFYLIQGEKRMRKNKVKLVSIISLLVCILIFLIKPITVKASSINNYNQEQVELQAKSAIAIDLKSFICKECR